MGKFREISLRIQEGAKVSEETQKLKVELGVLLQAKLEKLGKQLEEAKTQTIVALVEVKRLEKDAATCPQVPNDPTPPKSPLAQKQEQLEEAKAYRNILLQEYEDIRREYDLHGSLFTTQNPPGEPRDHAVVRERLTRRIAQLKEEMEEPTQTDRETLP